MAFGTVAVCGLDISGFKIHGSRFKLLINSISFASCTTHGRSDMITSKSLRWSGAAVSNGRQRLTACPRGPRFVGAPLHLPDLTDQEQYSFTSSRTSLLKSHTIRSRQQPIHQSSVEQVRLISLWGWGSSSPKQAEFAKVHSPQSTSLPDAAVGHDGQILAQRDTPSSHSVPAIHQTSDIPPPTPASPDPQPILPDVTSSPLDHSTFEDVPPTDVLDPADALSAITERIGYLKEVCGIDFGWGPSSMMQWILEHIHIYGDMSWATSIVLLAVFARLVIFFPMIKSSDMGAKWKATQPILGPVRSKVQAAYKAGDHAKMAEAKAELNAIQKEYGVNPVKMFVPILVQVPLQFGGFRVLRNMAELPVPALEKENWLWAQDLTLSDPFLILPVASAAITYLTIKVCNFPQTSIKTNLSRLPTARRRNGHRPTPRRSHGHPLLHHALCLLYLHVLSTRNRPTLLLRLRPPRLLPVPPPDQYFLPKIHGLAPHRSHPEESSRPNRNCGRKLGQ